MPFIQALGYNVFDPSEVVPEYTADVGTKKGERVTYRDRKTYFAIFLDDNTRQPICRLWFNTSQKYVGLFDSDKKENRVPIERLTDIFQHRKRLQETVRYYESSD